VENSEEIRCEQGKRPDIWYNAKSEERTLGDEKHTNVRLEGAKGKRTRLQIRKRGNSFLAVTEHPTAAEALAHAIRRAV